MNRSVLVDLFKALASQLILLHHLCSYAPMAEWLARAWPALIGFIAEDGRLAVQPFLVIGGFLAAHSLHKRREVAVLDLAVQRYLRLAPQVACALLLVVAATLMVGHELAEADWVSPLPTVPAVLAHLLLLQDVVGVPSVLAGAWYVAIDLQLFLLFVLLMALVCKLPRAVRDTAVPALLTVATVASILVFNRESRLDMWGIYFFAAYGLGALAAWSAWSRQARWCWWFVVALLLLDWLIEPRERPLWALSTALALQVGRDWRWSAGAHWLGGVVRRLSDWSYGVFVSHFAVIILVSGLWERSELSGVGAALITSALVVIASLGLGALVQSVCDRLLTGWNLAGRMSPSR